MSRRPELENLLEPERYELTSPPAYRFEVDRRDFFKFLGAGLLVVTLPGNLQAFQESGSGRHDGHALPKDIGAWLHIGEDGKVTVYTGKVEVGQSIRASLSQCVAEELHVSPERIQMVMGDTQLTPFDMGTFGSRTTPTMNPQLRKAAAAACDLLVGLAASQWQVDRKRLVASDGKVIDTENGKSIEYETLLKGQQLTQAIAEESAFTPATQWKVQGQSLPKVDGRDFVTGRHKYPSDQKVEGMLHGKVLRPTAFGASLISMDVHGAEQIPGVVVVRDGNFAGVAAPRAEDASRAIKAIRAEWKAEPQPSDQELFEYLKKNSTDEKDGAAQSGASVEQAMASADHRLHQTYTVSYIAHAPLEPRAALAQWTDGNLTVWTGTQRPFGVRSELAEAFRIPEERIRVLMPDMGSGYGGKHSGEAAIEAARLSKAAKRPVKLVWTREEEFTWAYFRPAGVIEVNSGVRNDGKIIAWEFHNYNSGEAGIQTYYDIPNQKIQFHPAKSPLRQGSYRALAATANHFARESSMDELAHLIKADPLEFRLKNLKNERLRAVFEAAAKTFGWGQSKASGHGFGIGGGFEKAGNIATCAEVAVDRKAGKVKILRVVTAFECGAIVNPDNLRNQIEGSNIMGLGGALFEAIRFENGRILNNRFSNYRVPRFSDVPRIETVLLDRKDIPSAGAGECPMVGLAPAIGNAIFDATGIRIRSLPMIPNGLKLDAPKVG